MKIVATLLTLCVALSMGLPVASLGSEPAQIPQVTPQSTADAHLNSASTGQVSSSSGKGSFLGDDWDSFDDAFSDHNFSSIDPASVKLINTKQWSVAGIVEIEASYMTDDVRLFTGSSKEIVLKEYLSEDSSSYHANTSLVNSKLVIGSGKRPAPSSSGYISYIELYVPADYIGAVKIKTESGNIDVSNYKGKIDCTTSTGLINVMNSSISGSITSNHGMISLELAHVFGNVNAHSETGSVAASISKSAAFNLKAETNTGAITNNFSDSFTASNKVVQGAWGTAPTSKINISSNSGDIGLTILQQAAQEYLINTRTWTDLGSLDIHIAYSNNNVLIKQSADGKFTLKEYCSINNSSYSSVVSQGKDSLEIAGGEMPKGLSYYSRAELYIPAAYAKKLSVKVDVGEITASDLSMKGNLELTVGTGAMYLNNSTVNNLNASSTTSSGELTINNSTANIDSTVNGRVNVYGSSTIKGTLTATEPTEMTVKPAKLSGDLTITNAEGSVYLSMPKTESFRLNASLTEQYGNIYNTFPSGSFIQSGAKLTGSCGQNPLHTITVSTKYEFHFSAAATDNR